MTDISELELAASFREVMSRVCTPVTIVTTIVDDRPHGTTVSAFNSLSLSPPMVVVSLAKNSDLLRCIQRSERFGVNVLGHRQQDIAQSFAKKGSSKFDAIEWTRHDGLPRLPRALGWLSCDVADMFEGGDHLVLLGLVRGAEQFHGQPLTYYLREFGTHHDPRNCDALGALQ